MTKGSLPGLRESLGKFNLEECLWLCWMFPEGKFQSLDLQVVFFLIEHSLEQKLNSIETGVGIL